MKTGPRYKIAKRLGASVFEKAQTQKFALAEERTAKNKRRRRRGPSSYGKQLLEKQKVRVTYGITERQFSNYVRKAMNAHDASPAEMLHRLLELRLDNIAYRIGLAPTRRAARQMVAHGHVTVNGRRTMIPSRQVHTKDVLAVRQGSQDSALFTGFSERLVENPVPAWLSWNSKKMEGGIQELPTTESADPAGDLSAVLSFYSR